MRLTGVLRRGLCRLAPILPESLGPSQRSLYDAVLAGAVDANGKPLNTRLGQDGSLLGPFNAMLLSPELGGLLLQQGATLRRGDLALSPRVIEMAILRTVQAADAKYPMWSHATIARAAGVPAETVQALLEGRLPLEIEPEEASALRLVDALLAGRGAVSEAVYGATVAALGERGVFELVTTVGFYRMLGSIVNVFEVLPPTEQAS